MPVGFSSYAILPAAGRSSRMGQPKLLLSWRESTVIEAVIRAWVASGVSATVIVVHPDDAPLADVCRKTGAEVVVAPRPPVDMKASVALGLAHLSQRQPKEEDVWLVAPADTPTLTPQAIGQVLAAYRPECPSIIVPEYHGRRGHPVLFPWPIGREVETLGASEGLNVLFQRHAVQMAQVDDPSILADLDTPDEYRKQVSQDRQR